MTAFKCGFERALRGMIIQVVAELIDKTEPHELEVVVFSDTNESISSVSWKKHEYVKYLLVQSLVTQS